MGTWRQRPAKWRVGLSIPAVAGFRVFDLPGIVVPMCTNYKLPQRAAFPVHFGALEPTWDYPPEMWPGYFGPILVPSRDSDLLLPVRGMFGLVPHWAKGPQLKPLPRKLYNARSETVGDKPSFRNAWRQRQYCLVPADAWFEPSWETGKAVRWRIRRVDKDPFALAGIYETRRDEEGMRSWSFSMLTVNAADHPLMRRFHGAEDEKRSVVVVDPADYGRWLHAGSDEEARAYLRLYDAQQFIAEPDPRPTKLRPTHEREERGE